MLQALWRERHCFIALAIALRHSTCSSGGHFQVYGRELTRQIPASGRFPTISALHLSSYIATTYQCPDIVVWSSTAQEVIELTVYFKTRYEDMHTLKTDQYTDLTEQITERSLDGRLCQLERLSQICVLMCEMHQKCTIAMTILVHITIFEYSARQKGRSQLLVNPEIL